MNIHINYLLTATALVLTASLITVPVLADPEEVLSNSTALVEVAPDSSDTSSVDGTGLRAISEPGTESVDGTGLRAESGQTTDSVDGTGLEVNAPEDEELENIDPEE